MWKLEPTTIEQWDEKSTHVAFFDENGDSDMKYIVKCYHKGVKIDDFSKHFGLSSVLIRLEDFEKIRNDIINLKNKYWPPNGCYQYKTGLKKVCFHSREIRKQAEAFSKNVIGGTNFMSDLNDFMESLPISITYSFIDKEKHYEIYKNYAQSPYVLAVSFILERLVTKQLKDTDRVIIILESRGKKEDDKLLKHIMYILDHGTYYVSAGQFKKISGVYFNPKRMPKDDKKSYFGLEIADLCGYPIFKYCRNGTKDKAFKIIEPKIYSFPNIMGRGLKIFP